MRLSDAGISISVHEWWKADIPALNLAAITSLVLASAVLLVVVTIVVVAGFSFMRRESYRLDPVDILEQLNRTLQILVPYRRLMRAEDSDQSRKNTSRLAGEPAESDDS
jgi:hypothetical protein